MIASNEYENWPLVPVDPKAIPEGYEPVRVGWSITGEVSAIAGGVHVWEDELMSHFAPRLIIRPIPKPIRLPLNIVPHGWWLYKNEDGEVRIVQTGGRSWCLPPWIAAQLPAEWHELPWDKSAVQQTEGGEG